MEKIRKRRSFGPKIMIQKFQNSPKASLKILVPQKLHVHQEYPVVSKKNLIKAENKNKNEQKIKNRNLNNLKNNNKKL